MGQSPNLFETALQEVVNDKKEQIPYFIFDTEFIKQESNEQVAEIIAHPEVKNLIKVLETNRPDNELFESPARIFTNKYELEIGKVEVERIEQLDHPLISAFYIELKTTENNKKIRLFKQAEANSKVIIEVTSESECTSPEDSFIFKTEYFNTQGLKKSDHLRLEAPKEHFQRTDSLDQFQSNFYLHIWSNISNQESDYMHPKSYMLQAGFTSYNNGDSPMINYTSSETDIAIVKTKPEDQSKTVSNIPELKKYYSEIIRRYGSLLLNTSLKIEN